VTIMRRRNGIRRTRYTVASWFRSSWGRDIRQSDGQRVDNVQRREECVRVSLFGSVWLESPRRYGCRVSSVSSAHLSSLSLSLPPSARSISLRPFLYISAIGSEALCFCLSKCSMMTTGLHLSSATIKLLAQL